MNELEEISAFRRILPQVKLFQFKMLIRFNFDFVSVFSGHRKKFDYFKFGRIYWISYDRITIAHGHKSRIKSI